MKKIFTRLSVLILMIAVFQSCTKEPLVIYKNINVSLKENESYQLDLGNLGNEEVAEITKQAAHFQTSQTQILTTSSNTTYIYVPSIDYSGTDDVEITITRGEPVNNQGQCGFGGSGGCNQNNGSHWGNGWGSCGEDDMTVYTVHFSIGKNPG